MAYSPLSENPFTLNFDNERGSYVPCYFLNTFEITPSFVFIIIFPKAFETIYMKLVDED